MFARIAWISFWLLAIAGLFLSGKTESKEASLPVLPETRLALDAELPSESIVEAGQSGPSDLRVALRLPKSIAAADALRQWVLSKPDVELSLTFSLEDQASAPITIRGADFELVTGEGDEMEARVVVARHRVTVAEGKRYRLAASVLRDDPFFADLDPLLLVGEARRLELPPQIDPTAGVMMLLGAMGIVTHLTMLLGRFLVPEQPDLPPEKTAA